MSYYNVTVEDYKIKREVTEKLFELKSKLTPDQKKFFHFNSVDNFSRHIFNENAKAYKKRSKLIQVNLRRNKSFC